jgi:hypothetical protein
MSRQYHNSDEANQHGVPFRNQSGAQAIRNFAAIVDRLTPELRAHFEAERAERRRELESYVARHGYRT